ncbi:competence damage-inducible protein A [Sulfolobus sp. A20]|uniref:nicotinamide mononucleotide deamidase-related protein n=1 Tax=Saccharolobus sp. A20 TaxID=1891280 RepID=UPI000845FFBD|nr:nicotinamide mononucleotide deamidase-related protein [Sulfolobus sp. A20]TRM74157.1 competence damage-inducible protein A [Sulfolobus sp. E5]TRM79097.1 competence damage-inducible protein A [Sulfolobus sp. B5]TRM83051.1 competence damage-inducible protein A [Sulfolobus sp. F3]TRM87023.1 competence damage-inducible protein A [Sulfolobus sp. C3]TRM99032.1 competence damage-inducible protein A [Sulfolobus sp. E1]TRN03128.1 competence damage-inducible protein A [Sulfolobus sp. F1]
MDYWFAEIITIGNEILSGKTVNTNASHIGRRLTSLGFTVRRITVVMDEINEIANAFKDAINRRPKVIISSGGLGPTWDDRTAEGLAKALGVELELNNSAFEMIVNKYNKMNIPLTEERKKMAFLPNGAYPVENYEGIAPGIYIYYQNIDILATPGVPREMENVLENFVTRYLRNRPNLRYYEEYLYTQGVMESAIAPYIKTLVKKYDVYIKTHPKSYELTNPILEIQIATSGTNEEEVKNKVKGVKAELENIVRSLNGIIKSSL